MTFRTVKSQATEKVKRKIQLRKKRNKDVTITPSGGVFPLQIEREYQRSLVRLVAIIETAVKERVFPALEALKRTADRELVFDAYDDDIRSVIEEMRTQIIEDLDDETILKIAERKGIEISAKNLAIIKQQYKQITGVNLFANEPEIATKLRAFGKENARLIKKLRDSSIDDIEGIIFRGLTRGQSLKDVTADIQKRVKVSKSRAKLIARDQTASLNGELTRIRQKSAGIGKYKWVTSGDERVRDTHEALNGKIFSWDDPPSEGHPGEPINCRCIAVPVFNSLAE